MGEVSYVIRNGQRIKVETVETDYRLTRRRRKPTGDEWVKFPRRWITALASSKCAVTYRLALVILDEAYKHRYAEDWITLSREVTQMPRSSKMKAVQQLEKLGLIVVRQVGHRALEVRPFL